MIPKGLTPENGAKVFAIMECPALARRFPSAQPNWPSRTMSTPPYDHRPGAPGRHRGIGTRNPRPDATLGRNEVIWK